MNKSLELINEIIQTTWPYSVTGAGLAIYQNDPILGTAVVGSGFGGYAIYHTGVRLFEIFKHIGDHKKNVESQTIPLESLPNLERQE